MLDLFTEFSLLYPSSVIRPDGTVGLLRNAPTTCKKLYTTILKKYGTVYHDTILRCLQAEIDYRKKYNKEKYFQTMSNWLLQESWKTYEGQLTENTTQNKQVVNYGTNLL
jgi:hypothetical protein